MWSKTDGWAIIPGGPHQRCQWNCSDTKGRCDKGAPGAQVIAFDPQTESSSKLLFYPSQTFFPVGTVTEEVNGTLWMGGIRGTDRIVVFQEPY